MKIRFTSPQGRAALTLLCLVTTALAFWTGLFTASQWDNLWSGGDYIHSHSIYAPMKQYEYMVDQVRDLCQLQRWQGELTYTSQQRLENLAKALSPERTNYRFEIHDQAGKLLYSNLPEGESMDQVAAVQLSEHTLIRGDDLVQNDYSVYDDASERYDKMVYLADGTYVRCKPAEQPGEYNAYGWRSDGEDWWDYDSAMDTRIQAATLTTQSGVSWPLTADDYFMEYYRDYMEFQQYLPAVAAAAVVTLTLSVALLIPFCRSAGRRRGQDGLVLNWQDRVPLDLYLCLFVVLITLLLAAGDSITYSSTREGSVPLPMWAWACSPWPRTGCAWPCSTRWPCGARREGSFGIRCSGSCAPGVPLLPGGGRQLERHPPPCAHLPPLSAHDRHHHPHGGAGARLAGRGAVAAMPVGPPVARRPGGDGTHRGRRAGR